MCADCRGTKAPCVACRWTATAPPLCPGAVTTHCACGTLVSSAACMFASHTVIQCGRWLRGETAERRAFVKCCRPGGTAQFAALTCGLGQLVLSCLPLPFAAHAAVLHLQGRAATAQKQQRNLERDDYMRL